METEDWIDCKKCGDCVKMPFGEKICWQCQEDEDPEQEDAEDIDGRINQIIEERNGL